MDCVQYIKQAPLFLNNRYNRFDCQQNKTERDISYQICCSCAEKKVMPRRTRYSRKYDNIGLLNYKQEVLD